jgi:hypothetical protein
MHLAHLGTSLKIPSQQKSDCCIRNQSRTAISYCGIGDLLSVASEARTNGSPTGKVKIIGLNDCRAIELQACRT